MNHFLEELDHKVGRWLNTIDDQVQQPIVHTLIGDVFTHDTSPSGQNHHAAQPTAAFLPTRDSRPVSGDALYPCALRQANALPER
jgi:hypothetical protein